MYMILVVVVESREEVVVVVGGDRSRNLDSIRDVMGDEATCGDRERAMEHGGDDLLQTTLLHGHILGLLVWSGFYVLGSRKKKV